MHFMKYGKGYEIMGKFLSARFRNKDGYHLGERSRDRSIIKLNANESPFPPSPEALASVTKGLLAEQNFYSDPKCRGLTEAAAENYGVNADEVFADSGSDVVLSYCMLAFGSGGCGFCFPDVTYAFYKTFSDFFGIPYTEIPVRADFSIRAEDYCRCERHVLLANPNAPSGLVLDTEQIERIVESNPDRLVIIDEAYVDYKNESCVPLIRRHKNLIVVQTMSKSRSLAGARVGLAFSAAENIQDLATMKAAFNPDSINSVSEAMGCAAIKDRQYMRECVEKIIFTREKTREALLARGFQVLESHTNFLFFKPPYIPAEEFYIRMKEKGVLVRHYCQPRISDYVRMTIGSEEQMKEVISRIDSVLYRYPAVFGRESIGIQARVNEK